MVARAGDGDDPGTQVPCDLHRSRAASPAAGVTDAEIAEVIGNLALNILTNYFNIIAGTDSEFPQVTPGEHS